MTYPTFGNNPENWPELPKGNKGRIAIIASLLSFVVLFGGVALTTASGALPILGYALAIIGGFGSTAVFWPVNQTDKNNGPPEANDPEMPPGPGPIGTRDQDGLVQTESTIDPTILKMIGIIEQLERKTTRLTWLTWFLGVAVSVACAVFSTQLSHLSH